MRDQGTSDQQLQQWLGERAKRLLDLTSKNPLMNSRPKLTPSAPEPGVIWQYLVGDEAQLRLASDPTLNMQPDQTAVNATAYLSAFGDHLSPSMLKQRGVWEDLDLLFPLQQEELERQLVRLQRQARLAYDDAGFWTLYMAFGALEWSPSVTGEGIRRPGKWLSPLFLVPVTLEREAPGRPFFLSRREGEDIQVNQALLVFLSEVERVQLELGDPSEESTLEELLASVTVSVARRGWQVHQLCWLARFAFPKLAIYLDLRKNTDRILRHPIIRAMSGVEPVHTQSFHTDPRQFDWHPPENIATVLPCDSSQLQAILAARQGYTFVIQGPPGTGKSQTIVNIIADLLAQGKTILFVSEKRAALEVVERRLRQVDLGPYCLNLHSHESHRRNVLQQIVRELEQAWSLQEQISNAYVLQLQERRDTLRDYTMAIHMPREPLGLTPFQVIGYLLRLPELGLPKKIRLAPDKLTQHDLARLRKQAEHVAAGLDTLREGSAFPWASVNPNIPESELQTRVAESIHTLQSLVQSLEKASEQLGLRTPRDMKDIRTFHSLLQRLASAPSFAIPCSTDTYIAHWLSQAEEAKRCLDTLEDLNGRLYPEFSQEGMLDVDRSHFPACKLSWLTEHSYLVVEALRPVASEIERDKLMEIIERKSELQQVWQEVIAAAGEFARVLEIEEPRTFGHLRMLALAASCLTIGLTIPRNWRLRPKELDLDAFHQLIAVMQEERRLREQITRQWGEGILAEPISDLVRTWQRWHRNPIRWLVPAYRSTAKVLRHYVGKAWEQKNGQENLVSQLSELLRHRAKIAELRSHEALQMLLAPLPDSVQNSPDMLATLYEVAAAIQQGLLTRRIQRYLTGELTLPEEAENKGQLLVNAWQDLLALEQQMPLSFSSSQFDNEPISSDLPRPYEAVEQFVYWWTAEQEYVAPRLTLERIPLLLPVALTIALACEGLRTIEEQAYIEWQWCPGRRADTWGNITNQLRFWYDVALWNSSGTLPKKFREATINPALRPDPQSIALAFSRFRTALQSLAEMFPDHSPQLSSGLSLHTFVSALQSEDSTASLSTSLDELEVLLSALQGRITDVSRYRLASQAASQLADQLSPELVSTLIQRHDIQADQIPDAVHRLLLEHWLEWVAQNNPAIGTFQAPLHETTRRQFIELDEKLEQWATGRAIQALNQQRESLFLGHPSVALLKREANKQRRHRSLRSIFRDAFPTILRVKPCWLMSPLSVSYFLQPDHHFDVVIIDEASQVRPEEAITVLYRADQAIVCGDSKQLPPTRFFESAVLDQVDSHVEDGSDTDPGESILEALEVRFPSIRLLWHYRSKDERLIAFSNCAFYHSSLITIPTPQDPQIPTGIDYRFVGGIYERGGQRINTQEVTEVCRLVAEFLQRWGTKRSLGVVTMNESQMNAILDELERRSTTQPALQVLWDPSHWPAGEEFFVKNLEAVQGDERDVIIVSTVYGRDPSGTFSLQLGPITQPGGERRLNVLVTRAREQLILVTSLQPEDFSLQDEERQVGLRILRDYLRFARDGILPTPVNTRTDLPFESEFERQVAEVVRSWGFDLIPQFGVGPYRIDLAVRDPENPDRIRVAIECDGATYHRLATVRDRDRLRQQWLERNGWTVIRVWSTDWWRDRQRATTRLRQQLETALAELRTSPGEPLHDPSPRSRPAAVKQQIDPPPDLRTILLRDRAVQIYNHHYPYSGTPRIADPSDPTTIRRIEDISNSELVQLLTVVSTYLDKTSREDLLDETTKLLGYQRKGPRIRTALERALAEAIRSGLVTEVDGFVAPRKSR